MPSAFSNWPGAALRWMPCTGSGSAWMAPGRIVAVTHNGLLLRESGVASTLTYTKASNAITLNFKTEDGDLIDALVIA